MASPAKSMKKTGKTTMFAALLIAMLLPDPDIVLERHVRLSKTANAGEAQPPRPERTTPPARNPEVAVQEEYQLARQRGTAQALELFIARHPDSPLADR